MNCVLQMFCVWQKLTYKVLLLRRVSRLEGYSMFKRSRHLSYTNLPQMANRGGGGVAVYVKNHLQVREKTVRAQCDRPWVCGCEGWSSCECINCCCVQTSRLQCPIVPVHNLASLLDSLEIMDCQPIIICGDLNENLLSNARKPLLELFQSRG